MLLEAGDMVTADGRILDNYSLQVNESSLTGESTNIDKADVDFDHEIPLGDRLNMVYSSSLVTYGRANVLVTGTGMNTEIGKIASLMNETNVDVEFVWYPVWSPNKMSDAAKKYFGIE